MVTVAEPVNLQSMTLTNLSTPSTFPLALLKYVMKSSLLAASADYRGIKKLLGGGLLIHGSITTVTEGHHRSYKLQSKANHPLSLELGLIFYFFSRLVLLLRHILGSNAIGVGVSLFLASGDGNGNLY